MVSLTEHLDGPIATALVRMRGTAHAWYCSLTCCLEQVRQARLSLSSTM